MKNSNADILRHIISYCEDIERTVGRFGNCFENFESDVDYRNSVCMSVLQIGELAGHLSEDFRAATKEHVDWRAVRGMRNFFAHNYGAMDIQQIWNTVQSDIPALKQFCLSSL